MEWIVLLLSLAAVTTGAELLVRHASALALRMGVSPLFVGLTIVGFGTSSPELAASVSATLQGSSDVSIGNVVGSNLFNVGVILGITALIRPIRIALRVVRRDLIVAIVASALPLLAFATGGRIPFGLGLAFVCGLAVYVATAYRRGRTEPREDVDLARSEVESTFALQGARHGGLDATAARVAFVVLGLVLLGVGARFFVATAIDLARAMGLSELLIGLTIVSVGTSLPEIITSVVAAHRRNPDIALGNIIGSNIFNVLGILGTCALVRPQSVSGEVLRVDLPLMVLATLALVPVLKTGGQISRVEGAFLVGSYAVYLVFAVMRGG